MGELKTVGERIKYARKLKGLTQTDIYNLTGISSGNLSEIENNKSMPSSAALILLKQELGVSIDWILTGETIFTPSYKQHELVGEAGPLSSAEAEIIFKYGELDSNDKEEVNAIIDLKFNKKIKKC